MCADATALHFTSLWERREREERDREMVQILVCHVIYYTLTPHKFSFCTLPKRKKERQSLEEILIGHAARPIAHQNFWEAFFGSGCFVCTIICCRTSVVVANERKWSEVKWSGCLLFTLLLLLVLQLTYYYYYGGVCVCCLVL